LTPAEPLVKGRVLGAEGDTESRNLRANLRGMALERNELHVTTSDGLQLSIERLRDRARPSRGAVVMLHGLGANHRIFLATGASLAEHLALRGFDCYVPDLRGAGRSAQPHTWTLDDYLDRDLPALIEGVLAASGQDRIRWIGHSMGGILMLMYGIEHRQAPISRLVTVGSALDYRPGKNVYQTLRRWRPLAGSLRTFPFGEIARSFAPIAGVGPVLPAEGMNFHRANVERGVCREIMTQGFGSIPLALFDSLNTTFDPQGFSRDDGRVVYLQRVAEFEIPTLMVAGSRDMQCPPETARATLQRLCGVRDKHALFVGKDYGQPEDYGHLDLLVGKRAPREVWPAIEAFLGAQTDADTVAIAP
jgi:pimeloyl-ACP methyl ester carboxylesterase